MNHVIVAFESEGASKRVCEMLTAASVPVRAVCRTGAEVIRLVRYMGGGVVVCGVKLADTTADRLYEDLDGQVYVLAVGKPRPPLFAPWPCETARSDGALPPADDRHEKGGSLLVYKDKPSGRCFVVWERPWFFRHWEPPPKGVVSYQGSPLV